MTGPLTIVYNLTGSYCDDGQPKTDMTLFMRLRHGGELVSFSGSKQGVCFFDFNAQNEAVESLIRSSVIPNFFPENRNAVFAVKAVDNIVEDNEARYPGCCDNRLFMIMDITIAVRN